jgi:hypothetical protein
MPELQQTVIDALTIAFDTSDMTLLIQGGLIALILGFMMSGMGQIIYYVLVALVLDLIVVPLGRVIYENDMNFGGAVEYLKEITAGLMDSTDAILYRALFFAVTLLVVRLVASVIRR